MLSYAGIALTQLAPFLRGKAERWWNENAPDLWTLPGYQTIGIDHLPIPTHPPAEKARLNTLIWPTGASRWGVFHAVCDYASAVQITELVGQIAPVPQNLLIEDDTSDEGVEVSMHLLAVRPLFSGGEDNSYKLQWLTFVDPRYFWWTRILAYTFADGNSWSTLLTNLVTAASGLTPTVPTVPTDYGSPNYSRWNCQGVPLPLLIDAAATAVGFRFLYNLDGTCEFQTHTAAYSADTSRWTANKSRCVIGGQMLPTDLAGNIPDTVTVSAWGSTPENTDKTLASLSLPNYGTITGVNNTNAWIMGDRYAGQTSPTAAAYTAQAATDYYGWALARTEATFRSICGIDPLGYDDRIEWEYAPPLSPEKLGRDRENIPTIRDRRLLTRIVPSAFGDRNIYGNERSAMTVIDYGDWFGASSTAVAPNDTWTITGGIVDLPSPGTYLIGWQAQSSMELSAIAGAGLGTVLGKFYDNTLAAYIHHSLGTIGTIEVTGKNQQDGGSGSFIYTTATATRLQLYAVRTGAGTTWTTCNVGSLGSYAFPSAYIVKLTS